MRWFAGSTAAFLHSASRNGGTTGRRAEDDAADSMDGLLACLVTAGRFEVWRARSRRARWCCARARRARRRAGRSTFPARSARPASTASAARWLTGDAVALTGATIDASGAQGGGSVRIGGDRQGGGTLARATRLAVDASTTITADAAAAGDGGRVVLWSDEATRFAGAISAKGASDGVGGDAEVSGKARLAYAPTADLTGSRFGTLLLDPYDVTISTAANASQSGFTATGNNSVINSTTLLTALNTANVTVATASSGTQAGNITPATGTPLAWTGGAMLTLRAAGTVTLNSAVNGTAGRGYGVLRDGGLYNGLDETAN